MNSQAAAHNDLWNEDLAPTGAHQRTWRWYHFAALWVGMVMCIPAYIAVGQPGRGGHVGLAGGADRVPRERHRAGADAPDRPCGRQVRHPLRGAGAQLDGVYSYTNGWNMAAFVLGVLPNIPGLLNAAFPAAFPEVSEAFKTIYTYAWFVGVAIAAVVYGLMMRFGSRG